MGEIDREVLATIHGDVLKPALVDEVIAAARQLFETSARRSHREQLQRELATLDRQLARMTEAIATGAGAIPALVDRLRTTDEKRREVVTALEQAQQSTARPAWTTIERRMGRTFRTGDRGSATPRPRAPASRSASCSRCRLCSRRASSAAIARFGLKAGWASRRSSAPW
jgi:hypothetical protein